MDQVFLSLCLLLPMLALGMTFALKDKSLIITTALPNGAASTSSTGIDLVAGTVGDNLADVEFVVEAPALTTSQLGDGQTITYIVETDNDSAFGSATTVISSLILQTGAGGAGDGAETARFRLPSNCERYVRVKATKTGASNASTASFTFYPVF